jgi:hypothetical protein
VCACVSVLCGSQAQATTYAPSSAARQVCQQLGHSQGFDAGSTHGTVTFTCDHATPMGQYGQYAMCKNINSHSSCVCAVFTVWLHAIADNIAMPWGVRCCFCLWVLQKHSDDVSALTVGCCAASCICVCTQHVKGLLSVLWHLLALRFD